MILNKHEFIEIIRFMSILVNIRPAIQTVEGSWGKIH
jgi:hypothetical protein